MRSDQGQPVRLSDYRVPDYLVDAVSLDIALHRTATRIRSTLRLRPNPAGVAGAPLHLDGDELAATALSLDGAPLDLALAAPDGLTIAAPPARAFTLEVETVVDPSANTQLMGLYRSGSAYCTQCEAEGFRRITYYPDRPDVLSVFTTRIEAELRDAPVLLGNGDPVEAGPVPGTDRHFAVWHDPHPKPCYLFAVVGGRLDALRDTFTTSEGRRVDLAVWVEPGKTGQAGYAMDALKRSMRWDEEVFGRAYDLGTFNVVAVSDFNMGAMENKGLNIFNDKYVLASPELATDADYAGIETVIAHEYFHNWTGNRITCRDWFQLSLKEGLTVFRDHEFSADQRSRAVKRIADVRALRARQFAEDAGPLAHSVRPDSYSAIDNFYTATVYEKGAEVVGMVRTLVGRDAFARGLQLYFERFDGTAATVEDFLGCFAEASGRDLAQFSRWYGQAGTPRVTVRTRRDAEARTLTLDLDQHTDPTPGQPEKWPFVIPISFGLVGPDGAARPVRTGERHGLSDAELAQGVIELDAPARTVRFEDVEPGTIPSLLRGFSAPVRLVTDAAEADLVTLMTHDSDPFNRWDAAQTVLSRLILDGVRGNAADPGRLREAFAAAVRTGASDPAFAAQVLALPGEGDLAREIGRDVDPDAVHAARERVRASLGVLLAAELRAVVAAGADAGPYAPDAAGAGRRAFRNAALSLLAAGDPALGAELAADQFDRADNMTDRFAALAVLSLIPGEAREGALDRFYARYRDEPLVVDKWFGLQASIPEGATVERVRRLMGHPAFSLAVPNRVYALLGAFGGNITQFNRRDGSGYRLVAEAVLALDGRNPQVAARMLGAFRSWRLMEPGRRALAETALKSIAAGPALSADVQEMASRSLR
ncbi:aminopeptidase N [Lichenibacterium dinghuense]|uniref:aminopeptidase N n=1 Tax=Lichenibacterium dinghuense TaxID=2895977 RepID=UPI001F02E66C|nr:aminopeptidase N [Lichenibacterium sp. 6Y81]